MEKDYVLGWIAWGIGSEPRLMNGWVLKGGTCLRKCYIETYRFSGDLDFSVLPAGLRDADSVKEALKRVAVRVRSASGIELSDEVKLKIRPGGHSMEARIYFKGPRRTPAYSALKIDITLEEELSRPSVLLEISHPYPDELPPPAQIRCYDFDELFAEKIRAMSERGRPRDLYDIVNLFRRNDLRLYPDRVREALRDKCSSKGVSMPSVEMLDNESLLEELQVDWSTMLDGQLVVTPELGPFLSEIPILFEWLEGNLLEAAASSIQYGADEDALWSPPATIATWRVGVPVEVIRFASTNHLLIDLEYKGSNRLIEPYSLRRSRAGHLLLHAEKPGVNEHRSYRFDRIRSVAATKEPFAPRMPIEFSSQGPLYAPLQTRRSSGVLRSAGPRYWYSCIVCDKDFPHKVRGTRLRPHKQPSGMACRGRTARYLGYY